MPRRRIVGVQTAETPEAQHLAAPHEGVEPDDLSPDVERVLDELGENASAVLVERMKDNKPGEWEYVTRLSAEEYTTEYIKEQFGGGEYKLTVIDRVQGRLNPILKSIDRRFVGKMFANVNTPVASGGVANDPFRDRLLEVLLAKALTPAAPPSSNKETIELVLAVVGALNGKGGSGTDALEQTKMIVETAQALAGVMHPPEGLAGVASSFLPVIERLVPTRGARITSTPARPSLPNPAPAPVAPSTVQPIQSEAPARVAGVIVPQWLAPFKMYAGQLVRFADGDRDPTVYADMALDELQENEQVFTAAVSAMNEDRLLSDLLAVVPALALTEARKEFAAKFVERIKEGLNDILSSANDSTNDESGEVSHG